MNIKRILMPTDFSPCSNAALDQAIFWSRLFDAELHLLHVVVLYSDGEPNESFPNLEDLHDHLGEFAVGELTKLEEMDPAKGLKLRTERRRGISAAPEIVSYAAKHEIDLIVLGTHGRRGLRRFMMGSVTEEVIRTAECPVLTVRGQEAGEVHAIRRILVPFDFSNDAEEALREAAALASVLGAKIDLVHVVIPAVSLGPYAGISLPAASDDKLVERMGNNLRKLAKECSNGLDIEAHVLVGYPASEICGFADKVDSDLIVIASHGLTGLSHLLLGSTSEKITRLAECPVLIKRRGKGARP